MAAAAIKTMVRVAAVVVVMSMGVKLNADEQK